MRGLLHVLAILLALPQVLVGLAFLLIGHLTAGRTAGSLFMRTLDALYLLFGWGGLAGLIAFAVLAAGGFSMRWRRWAAAVVAVVVLASGMFLAVNVDDWSLLVPGLFALVLSVALALPGRPAAPVTA
jgi:hypothetical protein